jgi:hypothetical protein
VNLVYVLVLATAEITPKIKKRYLMLRQKWRNYRDKRSINKFIKREDLVIQKHEEV